jgi:membrane-associated phospholipid phosphatase
VPAVLLLIGALMLLVDPVVGRWANTVADTEAVDQFRLFVQPLGREPLQGLLILSLLLTALVLRQRAYARLALIVGVVYVLSGTASQFLKIATHRPRPEVMVVPWSDGFGVEASFLENKIHSFPSGDVTIAAGLASVLFLALGAARGRYLVFAIPVLSALGRILGAKHYPSDCVAAGLLGYLVAVWVWSRLGPRTESPPTPDQATPESVTTSS